LEILFFIYNIYFGAYFAALLDSAARGDRTSRFLIVMPLDIRGNTEIKSRYIRSEK